MFYIRYDKIRTWFLQKIKVCYYYFINFVWNIVKGEHEMMITVSSLDPIMSKTKLNAVKFSKSKYLERFQGPWHSE